MNLLFLAIAFRAWRGPALSAFLRLMAAIATFSLELQLATWLHAGTLGSMRVINLAAAVAGVLWHANHRARAHRADADLEKDRKTLPVKSPPPAATPFGVAVIARFPPSPAIVGIALLIATLALLRPVIGADPYHLNRVDRITSIGTLAYDPAAADIKINALAGVYELMLADLRIPGSSTALVRFHGLFGLAFYLLAVGSVMPWLRVRRPWTLLVLLTIPVVFHQLVLVKNDLFGALPAFVALGWVVIRGRDMSWSEVVAAAALAGFAVGIKISSAPIALVVGAFLILDHGCRWRIAAGTLGAGVAGALAGGLGFALVENAVVYGGPMKPYLSLGNRHEHLADALVGVGRFAISLVDLGTVTPRIWPGRGGWGSTFGLPLVWGLVTLACHWRDPVVKRAVLAAGICLTVFGLTYPDADIAHRMVIAPALLLVVVGLGCVERDDRYARPLRAALIGVILLSALQIGRSAVLYLAGA